MLKQSLEQKQIQKLSPQQIMTAKLIELPIQSLEQKIRSELEENPVLDDSPDPNRPEESKLSSGRFLLFPLVWLRQPCADCIGVPRGHS